MKVSELFGVDLALWVARAEGHLDPFVWTTHDARRVVYLRSTDAEPYMPHKDWRDTGPLITTLLAAGYEIYLSEKGVIRLAIVTRTASDRWQGIGVQEAVCRARIGLRYGDEVPDEG